MEETLIENIKSLSNYIELVIEKGSDKERQLLPELINSLAKLIMAYNGAL